MDTKGKTAKTPVTTSSPAPAKAKKRRTRGKKKKTPGKNPQNRQEVKFEQMIASSLNHIKGGNPPTAFNYTELNKSQKYALAMVDPIHYPTRIPDADSNFSAMYRSYEVFDIPVRVGTGLTNSGAFSIAIQPKVGDSADVTKFKVAVADPVLISNNPQVTDWSDPDSYLSNLGTLDPRMVNEIDTLALNEAGFFQYSGAGPTAPLPLGTTPTRNPGNGFINAEYNSSNGDVTLPVGQFLVTAQVISAGGNVTSLTVANGAGGSAGIDVNTLASGVGTTNAQRSYIVTTSPGATRINMSCTLSAGTVSSSSLTIVPTAKIDVPQALTNGMMEKVRPVACCYWLTYTGTTLKDGGKVSTAVVNGDSLTSRFFSEGATGNNGNFRSHEGIGMVPNAMTDKLKTGCYGYIKPNNLLDTVYYPVDEHNSYKYNAGVIYGNYTPDDGVAGPVTTNPIRLIVCTVYEYQTTSQIPELAINKGSDLQVSAALNFLSALPQVMTNDGHNSFWDKVKSALTSVGHGIKGALDKGSSFLKTLQSYEPAARQMIETLMPMLA